MMLLALLLLVCYGCLAESQPPNPSIPIRTPPTLLDSSSSICPAQSSSDIIIEEELRKTKNIINSLYHLLPQPPNPSIPIRVPPTLLDSDSSCPVQLSSDIIEEELRKTKNIINSNYQLIRPCQCGGPGWTRVLYLNMADNGTSCPAKWKLHEEPVRGCGRKRVGYYSCDSVLIPVTMNYSIVCGRIHAYQRGRSYAF